MQNLLNIMISMNDKLREASGESELFLSPEHFAREFKTIRLDVGRRSGKTRLMISLARKADLIIVHSEETKYQLKRQYPDCLATIGTASEILRTLNEFTCNEYKKYDRVWIDEPGLFKDRFDFGVIYHHILANLFIKLGQ